MEKTYTRDDVLRVPAAREKAEGVDPDVVGVLTARLYALAGDARVPPEKVERFARYLFANNVQVRAMVDAACHAAVSAAIDYADVAAMAEAEAAAFDALWRRTLTEPRVVRG